MVCRVRATSVRLVDLLAESRVRDVLGRHDSLSTPAVQTHLSTRRRRIVDSNNNDVFGHNVSRASPRTDMSAAVGTIESRQTDTVVCCSVLE